MVSKPKIPRHFAVIPKNVLESLNIQDDLAEQRQFARDLLFQSYDISNRYHANGAHEDVTADTARWVLSRNDHSALRDSANEDQDFMRRMLERSLGPVPVRAICTRHEQIQMLIDLVTNDDALQEQVASNPAFKLAVVSGSKNSPAFPHFHLNADNIWRDLESKAQLKEQGAKVGLNLEEYDSVIPYMHWLDGDRTTVDAVLKAEAEACREFGFTWKSIVKASVHAHVEHNSVYGADYFRSVYDATQAVLEAGADCAKTSTGLGAMPPLNDLVAKDDGAVPAKVLPLIMAMRDFNQANDDMRWPKFSGGNSNEADGVVLKFLAENILGSEIADQMVIAGGPHFRDRHVEFIYEQEGPSSVITPSDFAPYGHNFGSMSAFRKGWQGTKISSEHETLPPELQFIKPDGSDLTQDLDI